MAKDQARAERIRGLKDQNPEITWDEIASYVGVSPRAAGAWAANGGIAPQNAKRLAKFFSVEYDWLYHGPRQESPDLMDALGGATPAVLMHRLDGLETKVDHLADLLTELLTAVASRRKRKPGSGSAAADDG
jgi:hypothetical protein